MAWYNSLIKSKPIPYDSPYVVKREEVKAEVRGTHIACRNGLFAGLVALPILAGAGYFALKLLRTMPK